MFRSVSKISRHSLSPFAASRSYSSAPDFFTQYKEKLIKEAVENELAEDFQRQHTDAPQQTEEKKYKIRANRINEPTIDYPGEYPKVVKAHHEAIDKIANDSSLSEDEKAEQMIAEIKRFSLAYQEYSLRSVGFTAFTEEVRDLIKQEIEADSHHDHH